MDFSKPGYAKHSAQIHRGLNGWYLFGNLFFGGLLGYLVVDPLTGAMWTLDEEVEASLLPQTSQQDGTASVRVVLLEEVPESLRGQLVRLQ